MQTHREIHSKRADPRNNCKKLDNSNQKKYNAIGKASLWQVACNHKHTGTYNTDEKEGECNENLCLIQFVINRNAKKYKNRIKGIRQAL